MLVNPDSQRWISSKYKTLNSIESAKTSLNKLDNYLLSCNTTITDWIANMLVNQDARYHELSKFIQSMNLKPASTRKYFAFIKSYIRFVHGIKLDLTDQKELITFPKSIQVNREPVTTEMIRNLCEYSNPIWKTFLVIQASSGMRASESLQLSKQDFTIEKGQPTMIHLNAEVTKTKQERTAYCSQEATRLLLKNWDDYFENKTLDMAESYFWKLRKKCGYTIKYPNSINYKLNLHSFRAFFRTQAGKINQDIAEDLIGHRTYLKQYIRFTENEKKEYYKKIEPLVRIFN